MKNPTTIKPPTRMAVLATIATLKAALPLDYRSLQRAFKNLKECGALSDITIKLNSTHTELKKYAEKLVNDLTPIAQTETAIGNFKKACESAISKLPKGTIVDNCDFGDRLLSGDVIERQWIIRQSGQPAGITLALQGDFYVTYAGDAVRFSVVCDMPIALRKGVATSGCPAHAIERYRAIACAKGIQLNLV